MATIYLPIRYKRNLAHPLRTLFLFICFFLPIFGFGEEGLQSEEVPKNLAEMRHSPTPYEFAVLSKHVYQPFNPNKRPCPFEYESHDNENETSSKYSYNKDAVDCGDPVVIDDIELKDWSVKKIFTDEKYPSYKSVLYENQKKNFFVLAYEGTGDVTTKNGIIDWLGTNIPGIVAGASGAQEQAGKKAVIESLNLARNSGCFFITGHSLGGWLAQAACLIANQEQIDLKESSKVHIKVVIFDSPGGLHALEGLDFSHLKLADSLDITNYLSSPNLVNSCVHQLGTAYRVVFKDFSSSLAFEDYRFGSVMGTISYYFKCCMPESIDRLFREYAVKPACFIPSLLYYTYVSHTMDCFIDSIDPNTQDFKTCHEILDWPCLFKQTDPTLDFLYKVMIRAFNEGISGFYENGPLSYTQTGSFYEKITENIHELSDGKRKIKVDEFCYSAPWNKRAVPARNVSRNAYHILKNAGYATSVGNRLVKEILSNSGLGNLQLRLRDHNSKEEILWAKKPEDTRLLIDQLEELAKQFPNLADLQALLSEKQKIAIRELILKEQAHLTRVVQDKGYNDQAVDTAIVIDHFYRDNFGESFVELLKEHLEKFGVNIVESFSEVNETHTFTLGKHCLSTLSDRDKTISLDWYEKGYLENLRQIISLITENGPDHFLIRQLGESENFQWYEEERERIFSLTDPSDIKKNVSSHPNEQKRDRFKAFSKLLKEFYRKEQSTLSVFRFTQDKLEVKVSFEGLYISPRFSEKGKDTPIDLKEIFKHPKLNMSKKRIVIFGTPGIGKTTFTKYAQYLWAKGNLWSEFEAIVSLKLGSLTTITELDEILKRQYADSARNYDREELNLGFEMLLKNKEFLNKTLLILDGYDELSKEGLYHDLLEKFPHILVTSRPDHVNMNEEDKVALEVLHFKQNEIKTYVEKYFSILEAKKAHEKIDLVSKYVKENTFIQQLAQIPICLTFICALFNQDQQDFFHKPLTSTTLYQELCNSLYRWFLKTRTEKMNDDVKARKKPEKIRIIKPFVQLMKELAQLSQKKELICTF